MAYRHGTIVWRELVTGDAEAVEKFYTSVFNWKISSVPIQCGTYRLIEVGGVQIAGIFQMPPEMSIPTHWNPYISVSDVDATTELAKALGAKIPMGPTDIANVGRLATVLPPTGGAITLFKSDKGDQNRGRPTLGEFCWEQLNASSVRNDKAFYGQLLGWKTERIDDSEIEIFVGPDGGVASLVPAPPGIRSHWLSQIVVENLTEARKRITDAGGNVLVEQIDVPKLGAFGVVQDPQGATFCVFESVETLV